jgi:hypothetical protein
LNPLKALRGEPETSHKDKDPYYEALLELEKQKTQQEAQIPLLTPLSIELDCPEGFDIDQFSWSKLTELRNARKQTTPLYTYTPIKPYLYTPIHLLNPISIHLYTY